MSEIPEDIMKTARDHFQKTFFSQDIDTTTCVAMAILAERERCANVLRSHGERQKKVWEDFIASGRPGPASSFHNITLSWAEEIMSPKQHYGD